MQTVDSSPRGVPPLPGWLWRVLAGIDTGAAAALLVLLWFAVHSRLLREPWWAKFNLAAAPVFGDRVYYMGPGVATLVGAALLFLVYSLLAIVYALLAGDRGPFRAFLLGAAWMACWHVFAQRWVWPRLDPSASPYFPLAATAPAHAAAAILLARLPSRLRSLRALAGHQADPMRPPPAPPVSASGGPPSNEPPPAPDQNVPASPPPQAGDC